MSLAVDMSLDDIISHKKADKQSVRKAPFGNKKKNKKTTVSRRQRGGIAKQQQTKFSSPIRQDNNKTVRVNVSNLALSVVSNDLLELFADYNLGVASVHFDENGKPRGSGELSLPKSDADGLIAKFRGVSLDGKAMKFALLDAPTNARKPIPNNLRISTGTKLFRKYKGDKKKEVRPKMTTEQLDAELDAYMSRGN